MAVKKTDPLFKKLATVSEQAQAILLQFRDLHANVMARQNVPLEEKEKAIRAARENTLKRLTLLEEAVSVANTVLAQRLDADLNPAKTPADLLLEELHKSRLDAMLQALFISKANEGPGPLQAAIDNQVGKFAQKSDWVGIQAAREQAENAIDSMDLQGLSAGDITSMKATMLKRVDTAAALGHTQDQLDATAIQGELQKGTYRLTTALNYARFSVEQGNFENDVILPTFDGKATLVVQPQAPNRFLQVTDYHLPELPAE